MNELVCFGHHLMVDAYTRFRENLENIDLIYEFLDVLPNRINMTKIMNPYVFYYDAKKEEDSGISGFVIIAESHISIHTFPNKNYLSIDVFSCKEFNTDLVKTYTYDLFDVHKMEVNELNRGLEFPRNINLVKNIVVQERLSQC